MTDDATRCPLCDWTGPAWEGHRAHVAPGHLPSAPAPHRGFVSTAPGLRPGDVYMLGDERPRKAGLRRSGASVPDAGTTESERRGQLRQRWEQWHGGRGAQETEAQELLNDYDRAHGKGGGKSGDAHSRAAGKTSSTLSSVVVGTFLVPGQLKGVVSTKARTRAYNEVEKQKGRGHEPPFFLGWGGMTQGIIAGGQKVT